MSPRFACLFAVLIISVAAAAVTGTSMVQGDTLWHIKAGEWVLSHRAIPKADPFSWTAPGAPWHAHEWLWEVAAALLWHAGGKWGVWFLTAFGVALTVCSAFLLAARRSGSPAWALVCCLFSAALLPLFFSARPHVLGLGLFALWLWLLDASRGSKWAALPLPVLVVLWANTHASAPAGVLAGAILVALERLAYRRVPSRQQVLGLLAGAAAVGLNPWGFGIWGYMLSASSCPEITNMISEWMSPNFHTLQFWPILGMTAVLVFLWPRADRTFRYLSLGAFLVGLVSVRHLALFLILWPTAVAPACASLFREPDRRTVPAGAAALALACLVFAAPLFPPAWVERPQERESFPVRAMAYMKEHGLTERVFNYYTWGGYLIWEGVKPFVDGRADMYALSGSGVLKDYNRAMYFPDSDPDGILTRRGVKVVLVPKETWLALYLRQHPGWREAYADRVAVVFVRKRGDVGCSRSLKNSCGPSGATPSFGLS